MKRTDAEQAISRKNKTTMSGKLKRTSLKSKLPSMSRPGKTRSAVKETMMEDTNIEETVGRPNKADYLKGEDLTDDMDMDDIDEALQGMKNKLKKFKGMK